MNESPHAAEGELPSAPVSLEYLLKTFVSRADELLMAQERTRGLLEAVVTVAEDLGLETVLRRVVDSACTLLQARYGALGIIGENKALSHFITVGIDEDLAGRIGPLPTGQGVLGLLISDPVPLRLHDLREHPLAHGFPPHHPPMKSFLGVPIRVRDAVFGNLYLTAKEGGGDFTPEDEDLASALAAAAGVAIENARLYEDARRRASWLEACMAVTGLMLGEGREERAEDEAFTIIAAGAREQAVCRAALVLAPLEGTEYVVAGTAGPDSPDLVRRKLSAGAPALGALRTSGTGVCMDDPWELVDAGDSGMPAKLLIQDLSAQGTHYGLLVLVRDPEEDTFSKTDVEMGAVFGSHVALALALDRIHRLREQSVVFTDRDRIARDLHDLVIQRLFAAGLSIQSLRRFTPAGTAGERIDAITDELDTSIRDLRNTIYSLRAASSERELLSSRILKKVQAGAKSLPYTPHLALTGDVDAVEDDVIIKHLLAVVSESLSNAVRHSGAKTITVSVGVAEETLTVEVSDDGSGFDEPAPGNGLANMAQRAAELNGSCTITSAPGKGTSLTWSVPLA